jgi:hypothetical protein
VAPRSAVEGLALVRLHAVATAPLGVLPAAAFPNPPAGVIAQPVQVPTQRCVARQRRRRQD